MRTRLTNEGLSGQGCSSVPQRGCYFSDCGGISEGSSDPGHSWGGDYSGGNSLCDHGGFTVHDGVESVDGVSGVLDDTTGAVRLHQVVAALDDVSVAGLLLSLGVSGQSVLDVVSVAVLGVGVVVGVDSHGGGYLCDRWSGVGKGSGDPGDCRAGKCSSEGDSRGQNSGGAHDSAPSDGHYGSKDDELKMNAVIDRYQLSRAQAKNRGSPS